MDEKVTMAIKDEGKVDIQVLEELNEKLLGTIREAAKFVDNSEKLTITVDEAAKLIGISKKSVYTNLIRQPDFPVVKIGKRLVILREQFIEWLENNKGIAS
jgi:excisionase family DNA binding protein